ncbi:CaiB/BaiF CoA transferase family protein [Marinivivus vitaminiproducens]|uniref:CaiB/BaiF CoA transferase family protein n=1 Tax=Marinivivus vitaminiproducens TaxID=3035935 RepID=UPI0027A57F9F|nr:CoA transferase [Geminicoccaceae bacterium SCSIO 64248]
MLDLLQGVRVVSFNHFLLGPVAIQALGDLGADVIAVEPTTGAFQRRFAGAGTFVDDQSALLLCGNRNKRSLAIDLKSEEGRAIARRLIDQADVVAENFRPGVMEKMGLGYEALKETNPSLVYASASGYGADGPYAERPGQDLLIQAMSGLAKITGEASTGPRAVGVSVADHHGAALMALGIVSALFRRMRTGKGCRVDVNLLSAAIDLQMESFICFLNAKTRHDVTAPHRVGGWYYAAPYGIYPVKDGHMAISLTAFAQLGAAVESLALAEIPESEAAERSADVVAILNRVLPERTFAEWHERFEARRIWHARVNDYDEVHADPQVRHNETFMTVPGATGSPVTLVNHPVRYDGQGAEVALPPQPLGAQTRQILGEIGYGAEQIERYLEQGVVIDDRAREPV